MACGIYQIDPFIANIIIVVDLIVVDDHLASARAVDGLVASGGKINNGWAPAVQAPLQNPDRNKYN